MADTKRNDTGGSKKPNEPPRLHIAHHAFSRPEHVGIGEYHVTITLQVELVNTTREMVHVQFLVEGRSQKNWQLVGDDGWCRETLVVKPATHPHFQVRLRWRHDPNPTPIDLGQVDVPEYIDPGEQYFLQGMAIRAERRIAAKKAQGVKLKWWERLFG